MEALFPLPTEQNTKSISLQNTWSSSSLSNKLDWTCVALFPPARKSDKKILVDSKYALVTCWGVVKSSVSLIASEKICQRYLPLKEF